MNRMFSRTALRWREIIDGANEMDLRDILLQVHW